MATKFKIGDRVRVINNTYYRWELRKGATGVIKACCSDGSFAVQFDAYLEGHNCGGKTAHFSGLFVEPQHLELIPAPKKVVVRVIKDGDTTTSVEYERR